MFSSSTEERPGGTKGKALLLCWDKREDWLKHRTLDSKFVGWMVG